MLDSQLPHSPFRSGENNILFQIVRRPGTTLICGASYVADQHLFRYDFATDEMIDMGLGYGRQEYPTRMASSAYPGGFTFGKDGMLYYAIADHVTEPAPDHRGHIIRRNPDTNEEEDLGYVATDGLSFSGRSCHAKTDTKGNLFFAQNGATPPQFFIYYNETRSGRGES